MSYDRILHDIPQNTWIMRVSLCPERRDEIKCGANSPPFGLVGKKRLMSIVSRQIKIELQMEQLQWWKILK